MKQMILVSAAPNGAATRVSIEVFDGDAKPGEAALYRFMTDVERHPESRPDWAAVYAHRVLYDALRRLELELDRGANTHQSSGRVRQSPLTSDPRTRPE